MENRFIKVLEKFRSDRETNTYRESSLRGVQLENYFIHFQRGKQSEWPKTLNYYCSSIVARSIIGNGRMWLNDVRKMNDYTEMNFAVDYIQQKLSRIKTIDEIPSGLVDVVEESYINLTDSAIWKDTTIYNNKLILAMCFSKSKDDAAMWDRYAEKGKGVLISFNSRKLFNAVKAAGHFFPNTNTSECGIVPICYGGEKCNCVEMLHFHALEAYSTANTDDEINLIRSLLHANVLELLVSHKHNTFSSEREYRIYSCAPSVKTWDGSDHIFEHKKGNKDSVHSEIFLPHQAINQSEEDFWDEIIDGVTLGPCSTDATKYELKAALESRGIRDKLSESGCPLVNFE